MILQALKEYYDRKPDLPRMGFEEKEIPYVLTLRPDGFPVSLTPTYEGEGKKRRAKRFLVPQSVKRSVGIVPNLLWDNPEYALGVVQRGRSERVAAQHAKFRSRLESLGEIGDAGFKAVRTFLEMPNKLELLQRFGETWRELVEEGANLTFQLAGDPQLVCQRPGVIKAIGAAATDEETERTVCLMTGEVRDVKRLHAAIKGVYGAQTSGANIVSFNLDAFKSFGKEQGANAPVSCAAAFSYTTALNHLLRRDSDQKMLVGDASTVFWAEKATEFERQIGDFFSESPKDDPDRGVRAVEALFNSVKTGAFLKDDGQKRFYVLGLAPNASRISVRFWIVDTVAGMATKICQHFDDLRIAHGPREREYLSLFRLLVSISVQGKSENIPPNLAGDTMRAILEGLPYPRTLLQAAVRRIKAEQEINHPRAALIKACLNRTARFKHLPEESEKEITMSLDVTNMNIGYRLGRLFAAFEKVQLEANRGINATIRDRFYGAASSTPVTVFANLLKLNNHHLAKLENPGRRVNFEKLIGEVMSEVYDFPAHLKLEDQGRFGIGYYHQMQDFFIKKSE